MGCIRMLYWSISRTICRLDLWWWRFVKKIHMKPYRNDINGLRAWAVLAVIFFHYKLFGFSGGFSGVDIFFVISGFLMTQIIIEELYRPENSFSVWRFYLSRARRIIPALFALCIVLTILGYFILMANDYHSIYNWVDTTMIKRGLEWDGMSLNGVVWV